MATKTFRITGRVIDGKTRQGLGGLRVEAWDKDLIVDDLVGAAVTHDQGRFSMEFTQSYSQELFLDRQPDLFFKLIREGHLIRSTEDRILWNREAGETEIIIEVDIPVRGRPEGSIVHGTIRNFAGRRLGAQSFEP